MAELIAPSWQDAADRWMKAFEAEQVRARKLADCLRLVRQTIEDGADGAVIDTIWIGPAETLVDRITAILGDTDAAS